MFLLGYLVLILSFLLLIFATTKSWGPAQITLENPLLIVTNTLATIFIIATLLERSMSVIFRIFLKENTSQRRQVYRNQLTAAKASARHFGAADSGAISRAQAAKNHLISASTERSWTKQCLIFLLAIMIAASGVQILGNFLTAPNDAFQAILFNVTDIFLSAGLLAGGSQGIAEILKSFQDYRDEVLTDRRAQELVPKRVETSGPAVFPSHQTSRSSEPDLSWLSGSIDFENRGYRSNENIGANRADPSEYDDSSAFMETSPKAPNLPTLGTFSAWRVAHALEQLLQQINELYPSRSSLSDGTIGDTRHCPGSSDHCPNINGVVTAFDCTHDPKNGCDMEEITEKIRSSQDSRIKYVIYNRRMFSSYPMNDVPAWAWRSYNGSNPHIKHAHFSVVGDPAKYDDKSEWTLEYKGEDKCLQLS